LLEHGATASAAFVLRRARSLERVRALLELSGRSTGLMYLSLLVSLPSGVVAAFLGHWWGQAWIWVSLALLIAMKAGIGAVCSRYYGGARNLAGLPYFANGTVQPPLTINLYLVIIAHRGFG
jgi:hypothetical protein